MPFGVSASQYLLIIGSMYGFATVGSFCVHLYLRPDRSTPNMAPYIQAQRDLIKRVQERKRQQENEAKNISSEESKEGAPAGAEAASAGAAATKEEPPTTSGTTKNSSPLIRTKYGNYPLEQLYPESGIPKTLEGAKQAHHDTLLRSQPFRPAVLDCFPVPMDSVKDLIDSPYVEIPPDFMDAPTTDYYRNRAVKSP